MKNIIIAMQMLFVTGLAYAQSSGENYVQTRIYLDSTKVSDNTKKQLNTVQYFDGLGRAKQVINVKASPQGGDIVTPIVYDNLGRQTREYLPVPQTSTTNGQIYSQTPGMVLSPIADVTNIYNGDKTYTEKQFESSPLDRVLQYTQVGNEWNTKALTFDYSANTTEDYVRKYETITNWDPVNKVYTSSVQLQQYFLPGQLYKNTSIDEDGNTTIEFKNGRSQLILVRKVISPTQNADTYYVYNEYNLLAYVIPPLASAPTVEDATKENLYYQYKYDSRNRLVEKKIPGKGWEYMVYDQQDRLILTQDAVLRTNDNSFATKGWLFTKYDQFGRVVYTGFFRNASTRVTMQTAINNMSTNAGNNESRSATPFNLNFMDVYYTKDAFPTGSMTILSVNYYDTYPPSLAATIPTTTLNQKVLPQPGQPGATKNTNGLLLSTYIKNIEDDSWTRNYSWYDTRSRVIGTYSLNHLGGDTTTETEYDFTGVVKKTIFRQKRLRTDVEKIITENFTYDNQNRLLSHTHQVDSNPVEILAQNTYNPISLLESKKVGGVNVASPLQIIDYKYNIRGWMTQINDPASLGSDLFGYKINYTQVEGLAIPNSDYPDLQVKAKYNGNIAEVSWKTLTEDNEPLKRYGYSYDTLNRLVGGFYQKAGSETAKEYFEKLEYDLNGNITRLKRSEGVLTGSTTALAIDNLKYDYLGNKLTKVTEEQIGNSKGYPYLATPNTITYDDNGNMKIQLDKGISSIQYNYLNLPRQVTQNAKVTNYTFRADGAKVKKLFGDVETDYIDGFQYKATKPSEVGGGDGGIIIEDPNEVAEMKLRIIPTAEGYYDALNNQYIYNYTDHLGNVRLSYTDTNKDGVIQPRQYHYQQCDGVYNPPFEFPNCIDYWKPGEIVEVNNYYPFGLLHNYTATTQNAYQYKYNGKELQETGMYDYGARFYMPDIGRWGTLDPKSELLESASPYVYSLNSPIVYVDNDGELPILINGKVGKDSERASATYWSSEIINTIKGSGIPNPGGQFQYVDGDRGIDDKGKLSKDSPTWPQNRVAGGRIQAKADWSTILSKLAKDSKTGKITEKIQIYTHSRGAAFGQGYTDELIKLIKANADKFEDPNHVIDFVLDMAPHQSDYLTAVNGVSTYTVDHAGSLFGDPLSDNDKTGVKAAFTTKEGGNWGGGHRIPSFKNDILSFAKSFMNGTTKKSVIDDFVKTMKDTYNIKVTLEE
jgi:RHS repeat-associated protein